MPLTLSVILSGCHAATNPSPGLGTAASLRNCFATIRIIGKDHSAEASGLHSDLFDQICLFRTWEELDLDEHASTILRLVEQYDAWYVSGLDLEARWLTRLRSDRILIPPRTSHSAISKPHFHAAEKLRGVRVPPSIQLTEPSTDLYRFAVEHGWQVWLKGPAYEARAVIAWPDFERIRDEMESTWGKDDLYLQRHIPGREVSIAFSALQGVLLEAVWMRKLSVTSEGKTWAGQVTRLAGNLRDDLAVVLRDLNWSGGGELEFVEDFDRCLWLIDWNPRFPAWIHGATIAGYNLPTLLLARASGFPVEPCIAECDRFIRVVTEIPVNKDLNLHPASPHPSFLRAGKHPSGMPQLIKKLAHQSANQPSRSRPARRVHLEEAFGVDLRELAKLETPTRLFNRPAAISAIEHSTQRAAEIGEKHSLSVRFAYSIKTDPRSSILRLVQRRGCLAEVISQAEVDWARKAGFSLGELIYNGPVPCRQCNADVLYASFADSVLSLRMNNSPIASVMGARIRGLALNSRFGVPLETWEDLRALVSGYACLDPGIDLGMSFHHQASLIGESMWESTLDGVVHVASAVGREVGRGVSVLDLGGGRTPEQWRAFLEGSLERVACRLRNRLKGLREIVLEPGKAWSEPVSSLLAKVVEVRRRYKHTTNVVVDCGISDLPEAPRLPREVFAIREGEAIGCLLPPGEDVLLGRLCMENDIVAARVAVPDWLGPGDLLLFGSAGAYDQSMSYSFGVGDGREQP